MEHAEITFDAAGFESLMSDFTHVQKVLTGVEDLHEEINFDGPLGDEVEYATTVLKLNDIDLPELAGQEGFMDQIKRAGTKAKEFIKQLIIAIRNYFKPKEADVKQVETLLRSMRKRANGEKLLDDAVQLATTGNVVDLASFSKERASKIRDNVRRLTPEERTAVQQAADQVGSNADIQDKVVMVNDNVRLRVNGVINRFTKTIQTALNEISRIDPTGESQSLIKINHLERIRKMVESLASNSDNTSTDIEANINALCDLRGQLSAQKDVATKELDHMASRGDQEERVLNRATSVLQELVKAVEAACNAVLSVDSAIRKTESEVVDKITREIFRRAASSLGEEVGNSLTELNKLAGL